MNTLIAKTIKLLFENAFERYRNRKEIKNCSSSELQKIYHIIETGLKLQNKFRIDGILSNGDIVKILDIEYECKKECIIRKSISFEEAFDLSTQQSEMIKNIVGNQIKFYAFSEKGNIIITSTVNLHKCGLVSKEVRWYMSRCIEELTKTFIPKFEYRELSILEKVEYANIKMAEREIEVKKNTGKNTQETLFYYLGWI